MSYEDVTRDRAAAAAFEAGRRANEVLDEYFAKTSPGKIEHMAGITRRARALTLERLDHPINGEGARYALKQIDRWLDRYNTWKESQ